MGLVHNEVLGFVHDPGACRAYAVLRVCWALLTYIGSFEVHRALFSARWTQLYSRLPFGFHKARFRV